MYGAEAYTCAVADILVVLVLVSLIVILYTVGTITKADRMRRERRATLDRGK